MKICTRAIIFATLLALGIPGLAGCSGGGALAQRDFDLARTYYRMGADYLTKKQPLAARRELLKSIKKDPEYRDPVHMLGVLLFVEAMHKLNLIDRTQCLRTAEAEEQRKVANAEFRKAEGRLKQALKMAEEIEEKTDTASTIYLANIALHFKRYKETIRLSKKALENDIHPSRHLAQAVLGWAYFKQGKLNDAGRELRQTLYRQPNFCLGRYRLSKVYFEQKKYKRVVEELEKIKDLKSCPIQEVPHLLGMALMKDGKEQARALPQFKQCMKMNPNSCLAQECGRLAKNISHLTVDDGKGTVESTPEG